MSKSTFDTIAKFIGNNDKRLIAQTLNELEFTKQVRVMRNASLNGTGLQKMTVAAGIRPVNLNIESRAGAHRAWTGRKLMVYEGMKIIEIVPEEAYLTFQSDMLEPGAKQIPFAQWVWEQEFKKIGAEINDNIYLSDYQGDAATLDTGDAHVVGDYRAFGDDLDIYKCIGAAAAGETPATHPAKWSKVNELVISKGWGKILADEITATNITPIVTGAIDNTNALTKLELIYNGMTVAHRKLGGTFKVSPLVHRYVIEHERTLYGNVATPELGSGVKHIYGDPKWTIESCSWMGTSQRVIATQKENLVFGTNMESDMNKVGKTIETLHGSKSVVKWIQGCEIADLETVYVNDQA